jgi:hypothetical protein
MLCESPWNGGAGYTPAEVGQMTLDQILFRLCNVEMLKREVGQRTAKVQSLAVAPDKDGVVRGRAADGTPIRGRIAGKSLARQLMEEQAAERRAAVKKSKRKRSRK